MGNTMSTPEPSTPAPTDQHFTLEPIAIVGMACRVPGAADIDEFWTNLSTGVESIRFFTPEEAIAAGANPRRVRDPQFVRAAPVLDGIEDFDAGLFGLSRREAEILDPQHRVFLECAQAALEHAGYDPSRYPGGIGVYGGVGSGDYQWYNLLEDTALVGAVGRMAIALANNRDYAPTFLSYKLNLRGPSVAVSTACSTGLVAVHLACEAVRNGECDIAIAGAASIETTQMRGYLYQEGSILSPDGHCRAFDADAKGTLWGSGGGVVVLKRLSEAVADGDTVHGLILGSAINNDGSDKAGFSAPSVSGQSAVIAQALGVAGVAPSEIDYVEAHGTGTQVGDPIEVRALADVFGQGDLAPDSVRLGTVKPNIGHLAAAAGVVGLIKTVLAMRHEALPPTLHFRRPNPAIDFAATPFRVVNTLESWDRGAVPRRAGVSSFGMGGTNAHAIVQEAPATGASAPSGTPQVLLLSAKTPTALETMTGRLAAHLTAHPDAVLDDVAHTLQAGRRAYPYRQAVVSGDVADAADVLGGSAPRRLLIGRAGADAQPVFLFPGQGAQRVGMAAGLYAAHDVVREHMDRGFEVLAPLLDVDLRAVLFAPADDADAAAELRRTRTTQPALFLVEYALARLWMSWGVRPSAMIGHSLGEYVAACLAGVFSFADGLRLIAKRAQLMQEQEPGAMLAVHFDADQLELDGTGLQVAAVNAPMMCVVTGPTAKIDAYEALLTDEGVPTTRLRTSHAFHSAMMAPVADAFTAELAATELHAPQIPVVSNLTGTALTAEQATSPSYWVEHLLSPVLFGAGLLSLLDEGPRLLLEVGPGETLTGLARMQRSAGTPDPVPTMPTPGAEEDTTVLAAAARLWTQGVPVDWAATHTAPRRRVPLPGHPFERQRHWIESKAAGEVKPTADGFTVAEDVEGNQPLPQWFWTPGWRQTPRPAIAAPVEAGPWLVLRDTSGFADPLITRLRDRGDEVVAVTPGDAFARVDGGFVVPADRPEAFEQLVTALSADGTVPLRVVHAWAVDVPAGDLLRRDNALRAVPLAFSSLVWLAQALAADDLAGRLDLTVLTRGAQDVTGTDLTSPGNALVTGPLKVFPLEFPGMRCRQVDVTGTTADPDLILEELTVAGTPSVAYRAGKRWVPTFDTVPLETAAAERAGLRDGGTYVITGGFGGVGLSLAEDLARRVGANVVLVGRSAVPDRAEWPTLAGVPGKVGRQARTLLRIEELGGTVLGVAADVCDPAHARRVRQQAVDTFGAVHGVIHAAGVAGGTMVEAQSAETAAAVLDPKVFGTLALVDAFRDDPLDFLALCSSVTAIAGGLGQVDYCAGNAFLDAVARSRTAPWPVVSMNWGAWLEVGMAAEIEAPAAFRDLQRGTRQEPLGHPLLDVARVGDEGHQVTCVTTVAADTHWVLDEHRIAGVPVMPGTGYLEMVRAAFARAQTGRPVELHDVVFLAPLAVPDGTSCEVRVVLDDAVDGGEFRVESRSGEARREHARGYVRWATGERPADVDLDAVRARCTTIDTDVSLQDSASGLLTFGSRWSSLRAVHTGPAEQLAELEVGDTVRGEQAGFGLHPALLDEATAFGDFAGADGRYLPLGYGRLIVHQPMGARVLSHLRHRTAGTPELLTCDLTLLDPSGAVVAEISDFMLRRIDADEMAGTVDAAPQVSQAAADDDRTEVGIRPVDGGEAFARLLGGRVGPQVAVTALHLPTLIGKVRRLDRSRLTEELGDRILIDGAGSPVLAGTYVAPQSKVEQQLVELWEEATGAVGIGVEHNFFDVGGNSLVASQMINRIRGVFGVKLPMRVLFEAPTVAGMAAAIEAGQQALA
jgi:phthiocerol/phenolphthiocerol synthesis type-I polyketide synthase E